MKTLHHQRRLLLAGTTALALGWAWPAPGFAQAHSASAGSVEADPATTLSEGEIRRLDPESGKLTIRHGEIRNLDMPPMTMVFTVRDRALLSGLKVGDRIKFSALNEGGRYLVTDIQR
ncbi:MAG: hypothetical protein RLZZ22_1215 [Pseudomonadota bacterium]|jgi:Cu/Ag efflux protein CusF